MPLGCCLDYLCPEIYKDVCSFLLQPLGKNLAPSQRTDIALVTLEKIIGDYGFDEKKWAETMLDVLRRNPGTWLMDVPEILGFIHANLKIQSTSVQQILLSVLDVLTVQFPRDVLRSVLTDLPQNDSTTLDILKSVLTLLEASKRIWDELSSVLQDQQLCEILSISTEELGLLRLTVSYWTRHRALLQGTLSPAPCLPLPSCIGLGAEGCNVAGTCVPVMQDRPPEQQQEPWSTDILEERTGTKLVRTGPPNQDEEMDEAFYEQLAEAAHSPALILMGDFNFPDIGWEYNMVQRKQSKRFLECVEDASLCRWYKSLLGVVPC
ncbi:uncharacterized protein LOC107312192 [Coturnix japonica]|uniref:uncharacterized protein LOC107312192 n=1 Tax=Coturnix japonica TaxID=93934 RepID=UPI0013A5E82B|nr:uncharacterized protein LOC107312192 [Coturnix japonica]